MNTVKRESDIIVCSRCGTTNRQKPHEVGQSLVCGNCKNPLARQQDQAAASSIQVADNEVVFYNEGPWLVTQKRICTSDYTIRTCDVQRVELIEKRNSWGRLAWWIGLLLFTAGFIAYTRYIMANNLPEFKFGELFFYSIPSLIAFWFWNHLAGRNVSLMVRSKTGPIVLGRAIFRDGGIWVTKDNKAFNELAKLTVPLLESIRTAIGKALAHSQND